MIVDLVYNSTLVQFPSHLCFDYMAGGIYCHNALILQHRCSVLLNYFKMYSVKITFLLSLQILFLRPTHSFLSDTNSTACVRPYYLTGLVCSESCPVGTFGNFDTGLCEECKLAVVQECL